MRDRFGMFAALGVCNGEHVERMVVVRIFVTDEPEVGNGLVVAPAVEGEGGRIEPFLDALRNRRPRASRGAGRR